MSFGEPHGYLLAGRQVLCGECGAALEQQAEKDRGDLQRAHRGPRV